MISSKHVAAAVALVASGPLAALPAHAFTARQAGAGGQGIYATSQGMPSNFVGSASTAQAGTDGGRGTDQPRDMEHHGRYTAGQ